MLGEPYIYVMTAIISCVVTKYRVFRAPCYEWVC